MSGDNEAGGRLRRRRTSSVTIAEEIQSVEQKVRRAQPDNPCHKPRDSLFSWTSGFHKFTGLVNCAFLLMCMGGFRLLLENFIKYGIRVNPKQWFIVLTGKNEGGSEYPSAILALYSLVPVVLCLLTEKGLAIEVIPHEPGMAIHIINITILILIPMVAIHVKGDSFSLVGATTVCFIYCFLFLKLWSYIQVNMWCRTTSKSSKSKGRMGRRSSSYSNLKSFDNNKKPSSSQKQDDKDKELVHYPDNLNLKDVLYFIFAPTLCYELNFPRTSRIRKGFLIKRIIEVVVGVQLILSICQQFMIPSVKNSLIPFSNMEYTKATERLLNLAIPNHLIWLLFFYLTFHSFMNLTGEIMYFADRNFYYDWWNAGNMATFWRTWNMPAHRWAVRHLYIPVVEMGWGKMNASVLVFFISAFFHEYLVSVPLRTFKIWAFVAMMSQIPLSYVSRFVEKNYGSRWGNWVVWASIILGMPLCVMMYYHDYVITHYGEALLHDYSQV